MNDWLLRPTAAIDPTARAAARARQRQLTKPPGALGRLETLAEDFAGWQGRAMPRLEHVDVCVFAADHGVAARGVSAFPQAVTGQMIANFATGGAAVAVLARAGDARLSVVNLGTVEPLPAAAGVLDLQLAPGSADFTVAPALTPPLMEAALAAGRARVDAAGSLFIGGEMGIGNTTSAAAVLAGLLDVAPETAIGRGTGVDDAGLARKHEAIAAGLARHGGDWRGLAGPERALAVLQRVGGLEIAALAGAFVAAAQAGVPLLVDGFITTVAALAACAINPGTRDWLLFAHRSAEAGHGRALDALEAAPLLDLGMRLGEGSGAVVALSLLRSALVVHAEMATFADAGVADDGGGE
ncbi:nicotinate-nucleotide--dimethylbenzimidazole phosphoribosyltransferase [Salinisphaera orenii]|uniref:Nicotinate-nucleotide--dimethylbenzimidazole phosphoribosyltransferase n=1 Tax=Salinisphaera orenii YIM 95161 TaxID=1051139 RepID=A0A423PJL0_9GAMM|nr:nicotinate-nucleotide--dimethylbenzimidazole phosphoribosyltransferase [Salinisphaera halophila]ROO25777.1 nicotinate-nucleotide--dimethylbenzimidazole phosphoribosyltransferase [Salinisphaera halophila YIM 95161]